MSIHTFSAFTSDISRNPSILETLRLEAGARIQFQGDVTVTEHGAVTTVTAVGA